MSAPLALVTGGVRRVGAVIAQHLAKAGYTLALHGHSDAEPEQGLANTLSETGAEWCGFVSDFGAPDAAINLLDNIDRQMGRVPDLIVNSASIFGQDDADSMTDAELAKHLRINMMVPVSLTTELAKRVPDGARASVIHVLDQRIDNPNRDQLSYTLSKQGLAESVRTLAISCADNLRVNGVAPGLTLTAGEYSDGQLVKITNMMPLQILPNPDDIAEAVLYFTNAKAVTGQIICVDGGANLKSFDRDFVHLGK